MPTTKAILRFTLNSSVHTAIVATLCCGASLVAQVKSTTTGAANPTTTGSTTGTSLPTTNRPVTPTNTPPTTNYPIVQPPIFISGKVQIADGTPLPTGVTIERVCGASTKSVAYTDSRGRFQFEWGRNSGMLPDASNSDTRGSFGSTDASGMSMSSNRSSQNPMPSMGSSSQESQMMGCELRAVAAGYRSDTVNMAGHRSMDNPDVGTIVLHRMGNVEGTSISATSFNAPKDSKKAYDKGIELMHKGKPEEASKNFEKAVTAYPKYADAWYQLGRMRAVADDKEHARDAYVKALEADSKLVGPSVELGLMAFRDKNWKEAIQYLDRADKLDPLDFPQSWFASAVAHYNLKEYDVAEKNARESIKLDSKHTNPRAGYLLGLILAEKGDFTTAAAQFREYLKTSPQASEVETVRKQLSQVEKLASSTQQENKQPE